MAKAISLDNLQKFRQKYDERLKNGSLVPNQSDFAKNLIPVSTESGDIQETPFIGQGTGTANGTSSVDTGKTGKHIQKQGAVYCVNQYVKTSGASLSAATSKGLTASISDNGIISVSGTIANSNMSDRPQFNLWIILDNAFTFLAGHTYLLIKTMLKHSNTTANNVPYGPDIYNTWDVEFPSDKNYEIVSVASNISRNIQATYLVDDSSSANNRYHNGDIIDEQIKLQIIDITKWFNANIPQDLLDHPENFFRYYQGSLAYNTGTLVASNGRYLVTGGRNVWDEETKLLYGANIASKNNIQVLPNTEYCFANKNGANHGYPDITFKDKDGNKIGSTLYATNVATSGKHIFTTPENCYSLSFVMSVEYGTTYNHDITISLYYAGEDYSQYYPYVEPKVYDTGTETLLSTGVKLNAQGEREDVYDYKEPSGEITRRVGSVDLSTLSWTYDSTKKLFYASKIADMKPAGGNDKSFKGACSKYSINSVNNARYDLSPSNDKIICSGYITSSDQICIRDDSLNGNTSSITGTLYYELATPATEQGTPFSENIEIEDFGDMYWYSAYTSNTSNTSVEVPQGCKIFYPAWYVGFIDTLGQQVDWDASKILNTLMTQSDFDTALNSYGYYKQEDLSSEITDSAGLTYSVKKVYKQGNIVTLTIKASNGTGNEIPVNTAWFSLPDGTFSSELLVVIGRISGVIAPVNISQYGLVSSSQAVASGQNIYILVSYAVA